MAMTHAPLSHDPTAAESKQGAHSSPRQFVPIRPAFRPLLPKPCTRDPSPPNGIHIHTRASLSAGRKRLSTSKTDVQKRRKSYPPSAVAQSPKLSRSNSLLDSNQNSKDGSSAHSIALQSNMNIHAANQLQSQPQTQSVKAVNAAAASPSLVAGISPASMSLHNSSSSSSSKGDASRNASNTFTNTINISSMKGDAQIEGSLSPDKIMLKTSEPEIPYGIGATAVPARKLGAPTSSSSIIDDSSMSPATPVSVVESPTSVNTASIFGSVGGESTPSGTIDPMNIVTEGDDFSLDGNSLSAFGQVDPIDNATLTPPDTQKPLSVSAFTTFGPGSEFDGFSDYYFRDENPITEAIAVDPSENQRSSLDDLEPSTTAQSEKDEEFSILEYLAPTIDMF